MTKCEVQQKDKGGGGQVGHISDVVYRWERELKTSAHYTQPILQIRTTNKSKLKKVTRIFWFSYCKIFVIYCC